MNLPKTFSTTSFYFILFIYFNFNCASVVNKSTFFDSNPEKCEVYLDNFALTSANFSYCVIMNSRPIKMCETCIQWYIQLKKSYDLIVQDNECSFKYFDLDRLQIVYSQFNYHKDLWTRAQCNNCFVLVNDTILNELTNDTRKFIEQYNNTIECLQNNATDDICNLCLTEYLKLNVFYEQLEHEDKNIVCMDVADMMNSTRKLWSGELKCCKLRQHPEYIFIISTAFVIIGAALFYIIIRYSVEEVQPTVCLQKRFVESLHQTPTTSIDR